MAAKGLILQRIVVAVDPAVSTNEGSDETGIIVAGIDEAGQVYVIADQSGRYAPAEWARKAVDAYRHWRADRIVIEANMGGDMVKFDAAPCGSERADPHGSCKPRQVTRAEPVSALYEQGRVHHVGTFPTLEDQMCSFTSDFNRNTAGYSPDRVDALVWALTSLTEGGAPEFIFAGKHNYLAPPKPNMNPTVNDMLMYAKEIKL